MLDGKRLVITGVITTDSIAFSVARLAQELGASIVLTSFGRIRRLTEHARGHLPAPCDVLELDVNDPDDHVLLRAQLQERWGHVDGVLHAIGYAPPDALGDRFLDTPRESAEDTFITSAYSYKALVETLAPLLERTPAGTEQAGRGSVVGLDFDGSVAWPAYNWMGVAKSALEAINRYLATELGPRGIRANLVSAGPIATVAARSIPGFQELTAEWDERAPLGWDRRDALPIARAVCFLFSDWSRAISGEILHVDGGRRCVGASMPRALSTVD